MTDGLLEQIVTRILAHEGGLADHPDDHGGLTAYGLTRLWLHDVTGRTWSDADMRGMSLPMAKSLIGLWAKMRRLDQLPEHAGLAYAVMDFAFHSGHRPAIKALQKYLGVIPDGIAGAETQGRWHQLTPRECDDAQRHVVAARAELLGNALSDPSQAVFARGWLRRLAEHIRA